MAKEILPHISSSSDTQLSGNSILEELLKQLILVATVFLSITVILVTSSELMQKLALGYKYLLVTSWILLVISIIASIAQFLVDYFFFKKAGNTLNSPKWPLWTEVFTLVSGTLALFLVIGRILFS